MWGKLDNQYSWSTGSAKRLWLPTPREGPSPLHSKICEASGPKWRELPSFTKGLWEQSKDYSPFLLPFHWRLVVISADVSCTRAISVVFLRRRMSERPAGVAIHHPHLRMSKATSAAPRSAAITCGLRPATQSSRAAHRESRNLKDFLLISECCSLLTYRDWKVEVKMRWKGKGRCNTEYKRSGTYVVSLVGLRARWFRGKQFATCAKAEHTNRNEFVGQSG